MDPLSEMFQIWQNGIWHVVIASLVLQDVHVVLRTQK